MRLTPVSGMPLRNWLELIGVFLILCGFICILIGIAVYSMTTDTQAESYLTLKSYLKTGLLFKIAGIVILILSSMFESGEQK